MIVRDQNTEFVMIEQHEHGRLSGDMAVQMNSAILSEEEPYAADVITAIYEHDRGWISLDKDPIWNDRSQQPFTFIDYPLEPKLAAYRLGLDEIERKSPYAALLCSMHYASFTMQAHEEEWKRFYHAEIKRQERLRASLGIEAKDLRVYRHFRLLQLCDDLSLYVCMNEPGVSKKEEHPWFREGFANSSLFSPDQDQALAAEWLDRESVAVHPSPFRGPFEIGIRYKLVSKELAQQAGLRQAIDSAKEVLQQVRFR
ncbi:DUF3891 family protein [Paenibacillus caui]|uniref:DUF3891 family protein n=1 Tax=Paenibacillus caui TaxID=2873927 RepID=UPI001CAA363A|nr:DUF3891 family protein [Paenibacillus caui]